MPVGNKLFSNSLLCSLIFIHYTNMKNKIVSCINRHLRRNNWFKLQRKKSSIVIRKSFLSKTDNDVLFAFGISTTEYLQRDTYHIPDTCLKFTRVPLLGHFSAVFFSMTLSIIIFYGNLTTTVKV